MPHYGHALVPRGHQNLGPNFASFLKPQFIHISNPKNATIVIANWPKFWFSIAFVLALCNSFGVNQCQNWLVLQSQKLVKVVLHTQQQLLILWSDILNMKCTPANFIGHLRDKSSIEITFHRSQKDISPIWVGFFKESMGILWLLYQVLHVIKWFLGPNNWNGPSIPSRFGFVQKTSICKQPCLKST